MSESSEVKGSISPRAIARLVGLLYLLTIIAGVVAQMAISERIVVAGDAATTASAIVANHDLYALGYSVYLVEMICQVVMVTLFYRLLWPAGRTIAQLSLVLGLIGCAIKTMSRLFYIAPMLVVIGAPMFRGIPAEQLPDLAQLLLRLNDMGAAIALPFFGLATVLEGYLILRSTFLPRFLGVLSILGGLGWLLFLRPSLGAEFFTIIIAVALVGAIAKIGWLLVVGVDEARWKERARAAGSRYW